MSAHEKIRRMAGDFDAREKRKDEVIAALADALDHAEKALAATREHNPWDLGPSPTLEKVRSGLRLVGRIK
jgi:hypothetical protein